MVCTLSLIHISIEKMFKDMCRHEVTRDFLADNLMNLEKLPKTS